VASNGVLIAGAGIGGLTAALALAKQGLRVTLFDQMEKLEEAGAGIQLSPNAMRILVALGLAERLKRTIVQPSAIRLRSGPSGREIATMRLDSATLDGYGAPYCVIHRADLQKALIEAIADTPQITLTLDAMVDNFVIDPGGVRASVSFRTLDSLNSVIARESGRSSNPGCPAFTRSRPWPTSAAIERAKSETSDFAGHDTKNGMNRQSRSTGLDRDGPARTDYSGAALIGADGLWSRLRALLGDGTAPRFAGRGAFRATIPAAQLSPQDREPIVNLWIGPSGHLVHYPVRAGATVNIVAVCADRWQSPAWSTSAGRDEVLERFPTAGWAPAARQLLAAPERWRKWALYDREPSTSWGRGPVTLLGDAAHPMLPFLAQGAAMAIEDAAVLARELAQSPADCIAALRNYENERRPRTARVQREARRADFRYHLRQPAAFLRDAALRSIGGERLLAQYDWIYRWRP
jgi:2-polyprenyl-6-methoxyphenol hydroxylase-like FAD-dependent oxidoreductase